MESPHDDSAATSAGEIAQALQSPLNPKALVQGTTSSEYSKVRENINKTMWAMTTTTQPTIAAVRKNEFRCNEVDVVETFINFVPDRNKKKSCVTWNQI